MNNFFTNDCYPTDRQNLPLLFPLYSEILCPKSLHPNLSKKNLPELAIPYPCLSLAILFLTNFFFNGFILTFKEFFFLPYPTLLNPYLTFIRVG
jgi:hypothetical protein